MNQFRLLLFFVIIIPIISLISCRNEKVKKEYKPTNEHELYIYSLEKANLHKSKLYKQFVENSQKALSQALVVSIPYSEMFYVDHAEPDAFGYRFELKKGQKVKIKSEITSKDSLKVFMDVFRIRDTLNTSWYRIASTSKDSLYIEFVARMNAEYILRIQPELLCDIQCFLKIEKESSLGFPVIGTNKSAIQSFFGDPRDGGRREHHGVDIFASRHTDIIASANGYVGRTGNRGIGGRHVWIYYPELAAHCYYAHLETVVVKSGMKIKAGTKLGTVGNSGNARFTPPHLHFGVYQSGFGPIDPYYYIATEYIKANDDPIDMDWIGQNMRTKSKPTIIKSNDQDFIVEKNTNLKVYAINTNKYRVRLPDGITGFIHKSDVENCNSEILISVSEQNIKVYNRPDNKALVVNDIKIDDNLNVLSVYSHYYYIKLNNGKYGWINSEELI